MPHLRGASDLVTWWTWLIRSPDGLLLRLTLGLLILTTLALHDLHRRGRDATRWREYAFLCLATLAAVCYGVVNDQVTSAISWEYFYYGKDLSTKLGPQTPPDPVKLHLHAAVVGIQATWTAGLILGVALLLANNPTKTLPRLPYRDLFRQIPLIFTITATTAAIGALLGYTGLLAHFNEDFPLMLQDNLWRPRRFMAVYGIHLGGYLGALVALLTSVILILRKRRRLRHVFTFDAGRRPTLVQSDHSHEAEHPLPPPLP